MPDIAIYHNPACGTSRNTLALLRHAGLEPEVIDYLRHPPAADRLRQLIAAMGMTPRALLRQKGTPYAELGLASDHWTDDQLIGQMLAHPILIDRPIVVSPLGTRLCRPSEEVLALLPVERVAPFTKEDGAVIIDTGVRRVAP